METPDSFESLVYIYLTTRRHIPENNDVLSRYRQKLKSENIIQYRSDFV
jgi:hypothetical protein